MNILIAIGLSNRIIDGFKLLNMQSWSFKIWPNQPWLSITDRWSTASAEQVIGEIS